MSEPPPLEDLGPATRSRYNTTGRDQTQQDKSQPHTESSGHSKDDHRHSKPRSDQGSSHSDRRSGRHDWNSGQASNQKSTRQKDESLSAKLMAHKEQQKEYNRHYKKIVENPILYLEERSHQIDPAKHQQEVNAMRFFGSGAESAAIQVLSLIDWAAEFLELSRSPVLEIPTFLRKPFVVGKKVKFPIPEDPEIRFSKRNVSGLRPKGHGCTSARSYSSGPTRQRRNLVRLCWGVVPARQSDDCTDKGCAQPQFLGSLPDHLGICCRLYILDTSWSLFRVSAERALPVGTGSHARPAEPARGHR